jgi:hypothetical protein
MKQLIGVLLVVFGICFGLYIGIWWGFVGGIIAAVEAFKAPEIIATDVAYAIVRIFFCQFLGLVAGALFVLPGAALCKEA